MYHHNSHSSLDITAPVMEFSLSLGDDCDCSICSYSTQTSKPLSGENKDSTKESASQCWLALIKQKGLHAH